MTVSWFLVIVAIVFLICIMIASSFIVIYMQDEQDQNSAWFPKIVVCASLTLACSNVLILPFDVTNSEIGGGLDMEVLWSISMFTSAFFLLLVIPFAYFYYENQTDEKSDTVGCCGLIPKWNSQFCEGLKWSIGFLFCFSLILLIMYMVMPYARLPIKVRYYSFSSSNTQRSYTSNIDTDTIPLKCDGNINCISDDFKIKIQVTFPVYTMALLAFLGWFLFIIFAGMGLTALPWDLFNEWRFRPKPMDLKKYVEEKRKMGHRSALLKEAGMAIKEDELRSMGEKLTRKEKRVMNDTLNRFENGVFLLKRDYFHLQTSYKERGGSNPIKYWMKLIASVVGGSLSFAWVMHICLFILPTDKPVTPFLNNLFIGLSLPGFPLFGVLAFAFYSLWLLLCTIKGNFRFGLRFACCRVFPMEVGGTLMNSFLANVWLILISSIVVVQFCALAFPVYARNTQVDLLFGTQIRYLQFFSYFFDNNVFVWILLCFAFIAGIWIFFCPVNESERIERELKDIMKDKRDISRRQLQMVSKQ